MGAQLETLVSRLFGNLAISETLINFTHEMSRGYIAEVRILHDPVKNLFIAFHAINEEAFEHPLKYMSKVVEGVDLRGRFERFIFNRGFGDLIKEELIGRLEIRSEAFIQLIDQLGQND